MIDANDKSQRKIAEKIDPSQENNFITQKWFSDEKIPTCRKSFEFIYYQDQVNWEYNPLGNLIC